MKRTVAVCPSRIRPSACCGTWIATVRGRLSTIRPTASPADTNSPSSRLSVSMRPAKGAVIWRSSSASSAAVTWARVVDSRAITSPVSTSSALSCSSSTTLPEASARRLVSRSGRAWPSAPKVSVTGSARESRTMTAAGCGSGRSGACAPSSEGRTRPLPIQATSATRMAAAAQTEREAPRSEVNSRGSGAAAFSFSLTGWAPVSGCRGHTYGARPGSQGAERPRTGFGQSLCLRAQRTGAGRGAGRVFPGAAGRLAGVPVVLSGCEMP